jgi:ABC-type dipeptide/oligopeptide/nickel transport system permease component
MKPTAILVAVLIACFILPSEIGAAPTDGWQPEDQFAGYESEEWTVNDGSESLINLGKWVLVAVGVVSAVVAICGLGILVLGGITKIGQAIVAKVTFNQYMPTAESVASKEGSLVEVKALPEAQDASGKYDFKRSYWEG